MIIKYKVIQNSSQGDFEDELENFTKQYPNYAIQYKPVGCGTQLVFTALVSYQDENETGGQPNAAPTGK